MTTASLSKGPNTVRFLDGGSWRESAGRACGEVYNPSNGRLLARTPCCTPLEIDQVVSTAAAAFPSWAGTPVVERGASCSASTPYWNATCTNCRRW